MQSPSARRWLERLPPLAIVGLAVAFNLWVLRAQLIQVPYLNDGVVHTSMVRWARYRIQTGHVPLDGWYPFLNLGWSRFHHYQSLPHVLTAYVSVFTGTEGAFRWSLYLLLSTWPISVYVGARLFGFDRWAAALAALISPLIVSIRTNGYEYGSYTWQGWGTWSQLWGMWMLPLAWGTSWRAVSGKGSYAVGALMVGLTIAVHFLTGYLALLCIGIWALLKPSDVWRRLARAAVTGAGALLVASWVIVPLLADSKWVAQSEASRGTFYYDSFGAHRIMRWLVTGRIFDARRLPILTLIVALGLVVSLMRWRRGEGVRPVLAAGGLSLVLYFGRPTLGPALRLLPGGGDLFLNRYIVGVHLAGVLLGGAGLAWLGSAVLGTSMGLSSGRQRGRWSLAVGVVLVAACVAGLSPAWRERASSAARGTRLIERQRSVDAAQGPGLDALIRRAQDMGGGRIYAGLPTNGGNVYRIGFVPVYAWLTYRQVDEVGFTRPAGPLSAPMEARFDQRRLADYDLFNVRYLILPLGQQPLVPATLVQTRGQNALWTARTSGYLEVVDTVAPVSADRSDIGRRVGWFLRSHLLDQGLYPTIRFAGASAAPATVRPSSRPPGAAGKILSEVDRLADGRVSGLLVTRRRAMVLLKATFDPRWRVTVDGRVFPPQMVAPSFVGTVLPPGRHSITFTYVPYPNYQWLLGLGLVTLLVLRMAPRLLRRRPRQGSDPIQSTY